MRRIVWLMLGIVMFMSACSVSANGESLSDKQEKVATNIVSYQSQFNQEFNRFTTAYFTAMENKRRFTFLLKALDRNLAPEQHLSSSEQKKIESVIEDIQLNWDELSDIARTMDSYQDIDSKVSFSFEQPTTLHVAEGIDWFSYDLVVNVNPNDELGQLFIARNKLWLAARLTLYDAYLVNLLKYTYRDSGRRQFDIGVVDEKAGLFVDQMYEELLDQSRFAETVDTIELVSAIPVNEQLPLKLVFLDKVLDSSYAYQRLPTLSNAELAQIAIDITSNQFEDGLFELIDDTIFIVSKGVGNTVGLFESREGKLKHMPIDEVNSIIGALEPLDILFEKTPFRLTDNFIPGHWGHVAIWVGGREAIPELKRLGVWQQLPEIEAYVRKHRGYQGPGFQQAIFENRSIVEALRGGVEINTLNQFLNVDDLAVIRANTLIDSEKREYLLHTFAQIGKPYDFNFDVETSHEIVCSELVFEVYSDFPWPVEQAIGRYTISPDNVAILAVGEEALFAPTLIYHDGQRLSELNLQQNFQRLLEQKYSDVTGH